MIKAFLVSIGVSFSPPDMAKVCHDSCSISQAGIALIQNAEGYSPFVYKDAVGLPTVGYGHLLLPGEKIKEPLLPIDAQKLLEFDVQKKERKVNSLVVVTLNQAQYDALVSFTFNVGEGALSKSTLLKRVNQKRHPEVPYEFHKWVYAKGKKLNGLVRRRAAEASLYALRLD